MDFTKDIKAIVFDLDGTLFHLEINWQKLKAGIFERTGKEVVSISKLMEDPENSETAQLIAQAEIKGAENGTPLLGVSDSLETLSENYKLAIVSRNSREAILKALEIIQPSRQVIVIGREDVSKQKPHPEGLSLALQQLEVDPKCALMVGDTSHDVEVAKHLGVYSVMVENPRLDYPPKGANVYVKNISELSVLLMNKKEN